MPHPSHCFHHPSATSCWVQISSTAPFSQIPLAYVLPLMTEWKFHTHIKELATSNSFTYFNVCILRQETTRQKMQTYSLFSYCPTCRHISMTCDIWSVCQSVCSWDQIFCYICTFKLFQFCWYFQINIQFLELGLLLPLRMLIAVSVEYRATLGMSLVQLAQIACKNNIKACPHSSWFLGRVKTQKRVYLHCISLHFILWIHVSCLCFLSKLGCWISPNGPPQSCVLNFSPLDCYTV